jgi:hypothetical protein
MRQMWLFLFLENLSAKAYSHEKRIEQNLPPHAPLVSFLFTLLLLFFSYRKSFHRQPSPADVPTASSQFRCRRRRRQGRTPTATANQQDPSPPLRNRSTRCQRQAQPLDRLRHQDAVGGDSQDDGWRLW